MTNRASLRREFISNNQWGDAESVPLIADASFRQYYRLVRQNKTVMLMDDPPEHTTIRSFLHITKHLQRLGLRVPHIFSHDSHNGFILLEDLGSETFSALLNTGMDEFSLYEKAIHTLTDLHNNPHASDINIASYDFEQLLVEADLFTTWYLPAVNGEAIDPQQQANYQIAWKTIFDNLPEIKPTLVLRDYHVDNLMLADERCALLDYQDALIGSPAYDVVSLMEDARRDIDDHLYAQILEIYFNQCPQTNRRAFKHHCLIWSVQRHCKVAGIFTRLWLRDNKPSYQLHLTRVLTLLQRRLNNPHLSPLSAWFKQNGISLNHRQPQASREEILSRLGIEHGT